MRRFNVFKTFEYDIPWKNEQEKKMLNKKWRNINENRIDTTNALVNLILILLVITFMTSVSYDNQHYSMLCLLFNSISLARPGITSLRLGFWRNFLTVSTWSWDYLARCRWHITLERWRGWIYLFVVWWAYSITGILDLQAINHM